MSFSLTPSKRPFDRTVAVLNGKGKWQKSAGFNPHLKVSLGSSVFRVLCPISKIESVTGKGGSIMSHIRQESGAKIKVEETVSGCDERIIVIAGSKRETGISCELATDKSDNANWSEDGDNTKANTVNGEGKEAVPAEDLQSVKKSPCLQKALLLVFEQIVKPDTEVNGGDEEKNKSSTYVVRLLVLPNEVGCLLGKGGNVIKQMSAESGAQIRIVPKDKMPACASPSDELVQITGGLEAARKALQLVSQQLLVNLRQDPVMFTTSSVGPSSSSFGQPLVRPEVRPAAAFPYPGAGLRDRVDSHSAASQMIPRFHESGVPGGRMKPPQDILTFRLLCQTEKVGGIIGKGGAIINAVQLDTGCEINVLEGAADSEDRIIAISGPAHPDDRISAPQEAVLRIQSRIYKATPDSFEKTAGARLLVASSQIGCLLGRGGAIIAEMRKFTGAHIRILGKEQVPKCASENEEVVQINGEFVVVEQALLQITSRLRHHFFRDMFPSINHPPNSAFPDQVPPFSSYMGRRELSPPGGYSNLGPSFPKFDAGGLPSHGGYHSHDDRPPFMNMHRPVLPHISDRPWGPQGLNEAGGSMGLPDYAGVSQRSGAGFARRSQPAIITNTTVDVVVPRSVVPIIYGDDGESLRQIRQISDANVTITEPNPGATETKIVISGTPEQTNAAQSLIQAFVISGAGTP